MKSTLRQGTKIHRILGVLASGRSLTVFEAQNIGDSCLASTVDRLQKYGVRIHREPERVSGPYGDAVVARYRLLPDQVIVAKRLLGEAAGPQ